MLYPQLYRYSSYELPWAAQDTKTGQDQGASYANQPKQAASVPETKDDAAAISFQPASATKAITKEEQIPLASMSPEIVYKDGKYYVEGKRFWSREEAATHQKSLALIPAK